jgi:hypothetical protein
MLTRFAAFIQLPILFAALFFVHMPHMVASMEARQSAEFAPTLRLGVDYSSAQAKDACQKPRHIFYIHSFRG